MDVAVLGIHFKVAPLSLRETLTKEVHEIRWSSSFLAQTSLVVLLTCNRLEIYLSAIDVEKTKMEILLFLKEKIGESLESYCYFYVGWNCFFHLCCVTAGLDSAILGETEIVRQVKGAYAKASKEFFLSSHMHYFFQKALCVAKSNRHRFFLEQRVPSLFSILWKKMRESFKDVSHLKILFVGFSEIHREFAAFLSYKGVQQMTFCTRFPEKVSGDRKTCSREELKHWSNYDVISCATISDSFLIEGKSFKRHLLFDLSIPRVIDPEVASQDVILLTLEQVHQISHRYREERQILLAEAKLALKEHAFRLFQRSEGSRAILIV